MAQNEVGEKEIERIRRIRWGRRRRIGRRRRRRRRSCKKMFQDHFFAVTKERVLTKSQVKILIERSAMYWPPCQGTWNSYICRLRRGIEKSVLIP